MNRVEVGVDYDERHAFRVEISFEVHPGEPAVFYDSDGSGYPGSDPSAEPHEITVLEWQSGSDVRTRQPGDDWEKLDELAADRIYNQWDIYEGLCLHEHSERGMCDGW